MDKPQPGLGQIWRYGDDQNRKYIVSCLTRHSIANMWVDGVVYRPIKPNSDYYARPLNEFFTLFNYREDDQ